MKIAPSLSENHKQLINHVQKITFEKLSLTCFLYLFFMATSIAVGKDRGWSGYTVAGIAAVAAAASLMLPLVGVPLALACASYGGIKLLKPHKVIRGRVLSELQHHRVAVVAGAAILGVAAGCSAIIYGLEVAGRLEHQLRVRIDIARDAGGLAVGTSFSECEEVLCAGATIVQIPADKILGVAKLSGFTLHRDTLFGWQKARLGRFDSTAATE